MHRGKKPRRTGFLAPSGGRRATNVQQRPSVHYLRHAEKCTCFAIDGHPPTLTDMYSPQALTRMKADRLRREAAGATGLKALLGNARADALVRSLQPLSEADAGAAAAAMAKVQATFGVIDRVAGKFSKAWNVMPRWATFTPIKDALPRRIRLLAENMRDMLWLKARRVKARLRGLVRQRIQLDQAQARMAQHATHDAHRAKVAALRAAGAHDPTAAPNGITPDRKIVTLTAPHGPDAYGVPVAA